MMSDDSSLTLVPATAGAEKKGRRRKPAIESLSAASMDAGLPTLSNRLEELGMLLADDLLAVEADIDELVQAPSTGDLAERSAAHLLRQRGKRIRPVCVLLGARIAGADGDPRARDLAVACELVHAATLLHDDVIDEGSERRGAPAARVVFGNSASILGGDLLLIAALERVLRAGDPTLLRSLLSTIQRMVAAEALQLERRGRIDFSRESYLRIVDGKTACLFRWALSAGARLGKLTLSEHVALARAGMAIGRAFQLIDDALDLDGDPELTGKDLCADIAQGKLTWPLLLTAERDDAVASALGRLCTAADPELLAWVLERVRASGSIEATQAFAHGELATAERAISILPESAPRRALGHVIEAAARRRS